jgi:serine/threonine protein kinase
MIDPQNRSLTFFIFGDVLIFTEVKCLVKQLLNAVSFLHTHWIIHRDIKMSNLLYNNKGELKLADFGSEQQFLFFILSMTSRSHTFRD